MDKIAILTLYGYYNFGNRLQNYAVQEVVRKFGYAPETLVVYPNVKPLLRPAFCSVKSALGDIKAKKYRKIYNFSKKYIPSKVIVKPDCVIPESVSDDYTFLITGSDQVWNPSIRPNERDNFFLSFAKKEQRVCISPSFGVDKLEDKYRDIYIKGLNGFANLCSREKAGVDIIRDLTGRDAELLIDPTLVLTKAEWEKVFSKSSRARGDYLVLAMLGKLSDAKKEYIKRIAEENSLEIIDVLAENSAYGPDEVLRLISEAQLVFTDSFHFTAFSINFKIPFVVCERDDDGISSAMFSRISSLLSMFNLEERKYPCNDLTQVLSCDFRDAQKVLEDERKKFYGFVERSLNNKNEG